MAAKPRSDPFARVRGAAAHLPEVVESTWYGTPALKVGGKGFARLKDPDTLVVLCPLDEKEMLIEADPKVYFETDHYKGWPAMLVRLKEISAAQLRHRLEQAWRFRAPRRLAAEFDHVAGVRPSGSDTVARRPRR
jgi:hypothetical protein